MDADGCIKVTLLFEDLALPLEFGLARDHRVEELDLSEEQSLRLQLQRHAVPHVVDELLQTEELDAAQRAPVAPVDVDLHLIRNNIVQSPFNHRSMPQFSFYDPLLCLS